MRLAPCSRRIRASKCSLFELSCIAKGLTSYSGTTATTFHVTYRDCKPLNIFSSLTVNHGAFFAVHFEDCEIRSVNFSNCIMLNVTFENCTFGGITLWTVC